jgi:uncharacterized protein YjbJ (UPF0337 family)
MTDFSSTPISWSEQKAKLKARFAILTDADLNYAEGKKDQMLNKVQEKLGRSKEELAKIIAAL